MSILSARTTETAHRRRMLDNRWKDDLKQDIANHLGSTVMTLRGTPSTARNLFVSIVDQLAIVYDKVPVVVPALPSGIPWWSQHRALLRYVLGLRECFLFLEWRAETHLAPAGLTIQIVPPDMVEAEALPEVPDVPALVRRQRTYRMPGGDDRELFDVWDIKNPHVPMFRIEDADGNDYTPILLAENDVRRWDYPFRWENGQPFLPIVLYHAMNTGKLFDPYGWHGLVEAGMDSARLHAYEMHVFERSSYRQRWMLDCEVAAAGRNTANGEVTMRRMETDPTIVIPFTSRGSQKGAIGEWDMPVDPKEYGEAVDKWEARVLAEHGLVSPDGEIEKGASGYAIRLRDDVRLRKARAIIPQLELGDMEYLNKALRMLKLFGDRAIDVPTAVESISYPAIPQESTMTTITEEDKRKLELGLISVVDLYRRDHPGVTEEDALKAIKRNKEVNNNGRGREDRPAGFGA